MLKVKIASIFILIFFIPACRFVNEVLATHNTAVYLFVISLCWITLNEIEHFVVWIKDKLSAKPSL